MRVRFAVTRRQNPHQRGQALAQALDTPGNQMDRGVGIFRAGSNAVRQVDGTIVHLLEQVANYRTRVLGMKRVVEFQGA